MSLTMFLSGALYGAFVAVLIAVHVNIVFIVIVAGGLLFVQYFYSDKMALYGWLTVPDGSDAVAIVSWEGLTVSV
jgi:hypothetical protein